MGELDGKRVLLTGGLGSLGRAQASKLAGAGAKVLVLDRPATPDGAAKAAALGPDVGFLGCDLNDLAGTQATVGAEIARTGAFDILINNAALIINRPHEGTSPGRI